MIFVFGGLLCLAAQAGPDAAVPIDVEVRVLLEQRAWDVTVRLPRLNEGVVEYWIERWTPGAYHLADYASFIDPVKARDSTGAELLVERPATSQFLVHVASKGPVVLEYRARSMTPGPVDMERCLLDVESNRITDRYAFLNPGTILGFLKGREDLPYVVRFSLPPGWTSACELCDEHGVCRAESFFDLEDAPVLMAKELSTRRFEVDGKVHHVTVYGKGDEAAREISEGCERIVRAARELMGGLPYRHYHFLIGYVPEAMGAGLEHAESTLILVNGKQSFRKYLLLLWHIVAHEFVHLWCAERIKAQRVVRPDFTEPCSTSLIWLHESVTEYFSRILEVKAGLKSREDFWAEMARGIAIGRVSFQKCRPLTVVSLEASHWSGIGQIEEFSRRMYGDGPIVVFALDLWMRENQGDRGIHDLICWLVDVRATHGKGIEEDEFPRLLEEFTGASGDDFYRRHIAGVEFPEVASRLAVIGYEIDGGEIRASENPSTEQLRNRDDYFGAGRR